MKSIAQQDTTGCGIACIAYIVGSTYDEIIKMSGKSNKFLRYQGLYCKELVGILSKFNKNYVCRYFKNKLKDELNQFGTIVLIRRSKDYPLGHYLVKTDSGWMDPWINALDKNNLIARSGFRKTLPGKPMYIITPSLITSAKVRFSKEN
jgi:hypothetical protein